MTTLKRKAGRRSASSGRKPSRRANAYSIDADIEWFNANVDRLKKRYNGKTLAVRNRKVIAVNDQFAGTITKVTKKTGLAIGDYMVSECPPEPVSIYTPWMIVE